MLIDTTRIRHESTGLANPERYIRLLGRDYMILPFRKLAYRKIERTRDRLTNVSRSA